MGYYLTIDKGNTTTKVALWNESLRMKTGSGIDTDMDLCRFLKDCCEMHPSDIEKAIICSVTEDDGNDLDVLKKNGVEVMVFNHQTPTPIVNDYKTPHTLGLDRLAAAVGAWDKNKGKDILVIDMGSAITYDIVTAEGHYMGGNIAPGMSMRFEALHNYTSRLPRVGADGELPLWGYDTETAIRSGVISGIIGEITYYKKKLSDNHLVILTGGDAELIAKKLDFAVKLEYELVSIGLNRILLYNENS